MKKRNILFTIMCLCLGMKVVSAAPTSSLYASSNYIESGSKVTATLRIDNVAAWNVKIISNGSTSGCDASFADATSNGGNTTKYLSVTCNSTGVGQISFRASGDATSADGQTVTINAVKVVTVTPPRQKDTNNYLKSLGVKDYKLTPEFNKDTTEYTVDVPSTINKVTIEGAVESGYASLTGTGEVEVNEGANSFEIKVTSETGAERVYKLTVNVKDENPIEIKIEGKTYTIMKNAKTIETPSTYEATTIKIKDFEIPAFFSETSKLTLVGIKDTKGTTHLAIYNKEKESYQLYNENKSDQLLLYIKEIPEIKEGFIKENITINKNSYECLKLNVQSNYVLVYAMNIVTGKSDYYVYDAEQNTYTLYNDEESISFKKEIEKYKNAILILSGTVIILFLIILILLLRKPKKKKEKKDEVKVTKVVLEKTKNKEEVVPEKKKKKKAHQEAPVNKKESLKTNEDVVKEVNKATEIIEEYEKTMRLNKKDLEERKKELEATMFDILSEDKKKRKKQK